MVFIRNRIGLMSESLETLQEGMRQLKEAGAESPGHKLYLPYVLIFSELSRRGNHVESTGVDCREWACSL